MGRPRILALAGRGDRHPMRYAESAGRPRTLDLAGAPGMGMA